MVLHIKAKGGGIVARPKKITPVRVEVPTFEEKLTGLFAQGRSIDHLKRVCGYIGKEKEFQLWLQSREITKRGPEST